MSLADKVAALRAFFGVHPDEEVPTVLQLAEHGGEDEGCWLLLESAAAEADADA